MIKGKLMNFLYLSAEFDDQIIETFFDKGKSPNYAANKYHKLLSAGLSENGAPVNVYATLPISKATSSRKIVKWKSCKSKNFVKQYISYLNIRGIKHAILAAKSFFKSLFAPQNTVVIYDALVMSSSFGAVLAAKLRRHKCIAIITDLPDYINHSQAKNRINHRLISMADGYVFLTEPMNDVINPSQKPYVVLEGHADLAMKNVPCISDNTSKKIVLYAGALFEKYGIANLVHSFIKTAKANEELHIYGDGEYANTLKEIADSHAQIIYHGPRPNHEIVEAECSATLLVNPRAGDEDYTKYSFPSKTMEYMASGTPVLCAKLPGFPDEYDGYLFYFDDARQDGLANALRSVLDLPANELEIMGQKAKSFVLEEKNHIKQAEHIIRFVTDTWSLS